MEEMISFDYIKELELELRTRKLANPSYSLRAFADNLGFSHTSLSQNLAGRRHLSKGNLFKAADRLGWSQLEITVALNQCKAKGVTHSPLLQKDFNGALLDHDKFKVISQWYYLAILNFIRINDGFTNIKTMSLRLGLNLRLTSDAVARLKKLKYLKQSKGQWTRTLLPIRAMVDRASSAIRNYHRQNLDLAKTAINQVNVTEREISSMTMAIDKAKLPAAKQKIIKFKREMSEFLEKGQKNEVYTLSIQLFPLTKELSKGRVPHD